MMEQKKINRINELSKKSKAEGLTEAEKIEQKALRAEYIMLFRKNLIHTLDDVSVQQDDGSVKHMKDVRIQKDIKASKDND